MTDDLRLESLYVGNRVSLEGGDRLISKFFMPLEDVRDNVFICGAAQSGKTVFAKSIIEEAVLKHIPVIAVDFKGDISSLGLLFPSTSAEYYNFFEDEEGTSEFSQDRARQAFEDHIHLMAKYGLNEDYIKALKTAAQFAIFTPRSTSGIPLAFSLIPPPPADINRMYETNRGIIFILIDIQVSALMSRLYSSTEAINKERERNYLSEIILYCWLNAIATQGMKGLAAFIDLVIKPPFDTIGGVEVDRYMPADVRAQVVAKLHSHAAGAEQLWYNGVPVDMSLFTEEKFGTPLSIINISELDSYEDKFFVISRLAYHIYDWMRFSGPSDRIRLVLYIDEIGGKRSFLPGDPFHFVLRQALDLLIHESKRYGVCCIFATQSPEDVNYEGFNACGTWAIGRLAKVSERERMLEDSFRAGVRFDKFATFVDLVANEQFLLKLHSGEVTLVKERRLASFHRIVSSALLHKVISPHVTNYFRMFYVGDTSHTPEGEVRAHVGELSPETVFESFHFGIGRGEPFILTSEPQECIKRVLDELGKEGILPQEVLFRNAQVLVARVHRADWKVDTLSRDSMGNVAERVKEEGRFCRFDTPCKINTEHEAVLSDLAAQAPSPLSDMLWEKVAVLMPVSSHMTDIDVKSHIGREMNIHPKEVQVALVEGNVVLLWKLTIEYRGKIFDCQFDMVTKEIRIEFPEFTKENCLAEAHAAYPDLALQESDIALRGFLFIINRSTDEYTYQLKISRKSGKIISHRRIITAQRAAALARQRMNQDYFSSWQVNSFWNFYYTGGEIVVIDEETELLVTKQAIAASDAESLAHAELVKVTGDRGFYVVKKDFKNGTWYLQCASKQWSSVVEIDNTGLITPTLRLVKDYCLQEAKAILAKNKISVTTGEEARQFNDGWEFEFLSSLGYFMVKIDSKCREFYKERLTPEGVKHFIELELGGTVAHVRDGNEFWVAILKKGNTKYTVRFNKQTGMVESVYAGWLFFQRAVPIDQVRITGG